MIYWKTLIMFWSSCVWSKVTVVHNWTLHCTIARYYWTLTSYAFNGISFYITWRYIIQSNDKNLHRCYIKINRIWVAVYYHICISTSLGDLQMVIVHIVSTFRFLWRFLHTICFMTTPVYTCIYLSDGASASIIMRACIK